MKLIASLAAFACIFALNIIIAITPSGCVSAETPHAAARLAATARILDDSAQARAELSAEFKRLTREHRLYAEELVKATGGTTEDVDRLEAEWRAKAAKR